MLMKNNLCSMGKQKSTCKYTTEHPCNFFFTLKDISIFFNRSSSLAYLFTLGLTDLVKI
jgi:hypothetical protein